MVELFGLRYRCCHFSSHAPKHNTCFRLHLRGVLKRAARSTHVDVSKVRSWCDKRHLDGTRFGGTHRPPNVALHFLCIALRHVADHSACVLHKIPPEPKKYETHRATKVTENGPKTNRGPTFPSIARKRQYEISCESWRYVAPVGHHKVFGSWNPQKTRMER